MQPTVSIDYSKYIRLYDNGSVAILKKPPQSVCRVLQGGQDGI